MDANHLKAAVCDKVLHVNPNALVATVQTVRLGYQALVKRTDTSPATIIWADSCAREKYIDAARDAAIALGIIAQRCQPPH